MHESRVSHLVCLARALVRALSSLTKRLILQDLAPRNLLRDTAHGSRFYIIDFQKARYFPKAQAEPPKVPKQFLRIEPEARGDRPFLDPFAADVFCLGCLFDSLIWHPFGV